MEADANAIQRIKFDNVTHNRTLGVMGDKSPKANRKHAAQDQAKSNASKNKKDAATAAKQIPKAKK